MTLLQQISDLESDIRNHKITSEIANSRLKYLYINNLRDFVNEYYDSDDKNIDEKIIKFWDL
jgi:hypothetical protein